MPLTGTISRLIAGRAFKQVLAVLLLIEAVSLAESLGALVEDEEDFVVYDASTGDDVTHTVLQQISVERARHG